MNILNLRRLFLPALMALAALIMLPACSTTEEEAADSSVPCDIDPGQPECLEQLK